MDILVWFDCKFYANFDSVKKNDALPTHFHENRFLRFLEFVIEIKNRNNERIWVYPSDMGIVRIVFLR